MKKRRLGSIKEGQDKDGRPRFYPYVTVDGKRLSSSFGTRWEAEQWIEETYRDRSAKQDEPADLLFSEASDRMIADATVSRGQRDNYIVTQRQLLRQWGGKRLSEITRSDVADYLSQRKKEVGVSILRRELSFLRLVYEKAKDYGIDIPSPELAIKRPQHRMESREDRLDKLIRAEEIQAMLEHSQGLLRAYLLVLLYTGMRPSEAAGLWWERPASNDWLRGYVDLERGGFSMVGTKTETRFVPAHPVLHSLFSNLKRTGPLVFVPTLYIGHNRPYMHFRKSFDAVKRKAGIERDVTLYSFRHTARSQMEACGISTAIAETIIGHKEKGFKFTYIHLSDEVLIRGIGKLSY